MKIIDFIFIGSLLLSFVSCASFSASEVRSELLAAKLSIKCNEDDDAIASLSRVLMLSPDNEDALRLRGECNFRKKNYSSALNDFNVLCNLKDKSEYLLLKARTEYEMNLYSETIYDSIKAISISEDEKEIFTFWNLLANSYSEIQDYIEAEKYYSLMLQRKKHPAIYSERAYNYVYMCEYQKAKDDLKEIANLTKDCTKTERENILDDEYYYLVGYCELALENLENALMSFNRIKNKRQFDKLEEYISACQR